MYLITGGVGFLACVIFILILIFAAARGKSATVPLVAFILSMVLFLGSGFLYSRTDPQIGGTVFLEYITRNQTVPPNLEGEWREDGSEKSDSYHGIYITDKTIEIYWVSDGGKSRTLYWAGTYDPPTDGREPYTWESKNDTRRTSAALLAAGDSTKEFTYKNGKLHYNASVLGVTTEMKAEKVSWGYFGIEDNPEDAAGNGEDGTETEPETIAASGELENASVTVKSAALTQDFEGNPALVVTCSWINNTQDTLSAMAAINAQAYQDGKALEAAMVVASELYAPEPALNDLIPGSGTDMQYAFALSSETTPVEFQLTAANVEDGAVVSAVFDLVQLAEQAAEQADQTA